MNLEWVQVQTHGVKSSTVSLDLEDEDGHDFCQFQCKLNKEETEKIADFLKLDLDDVCTYITKESFGEEQVPS
jgi:hypothetical protein